MIWCAVKDGTVFHGGGNGDGVDCEEDDDDEDDDGNGRTYLKIATNTRCDAKQVSPYGKTTDQNAVSEKIAADDDSSSVIISCLRWLDSFDN